MYAVGSSNWFATWSQVASILVNFDRLRLVEQVKVEYLANNRLAKRVIGPKSVRVGGGFVCFLACRLIAVVGR